jgi:hypothetical protein
MKARQGPAATQLLLAPITVTLKVDELDVLLAQLRRGRRRVSRSTLRAPTRWWCAAGAGTAAAREDVRDAGARRDRRRDRRGASHHLDSASDRLLGTIACRSAIRIGASRFPR